MHLRGSASPREISRCWRKRVRPWPAPAPRGRRRRAKGYRLPVRGRKTTLQVSVTNLFNEGYRPFPGTPTIGRTILARVKYDF
jgi:hypothetical protein